MTTIIERTPATRATLVKSILIYLAFTTAWVYGFANAIESAKAPEATVCQF